MKNISEGFIDKSKITIKNDNMDKIPDINHKIFKFDNIKDVCEYIVHKLKFTGK